MESKRFIFLESITPTFKNYLKNKRSKNPITHIISHILWNHKNSRLFIFLGIRGYHYSTNLRLRRILKELFYFTEIENRRTQEIKSP